MAQDKPNVILFMADDVGHECFGAYGSKQYKTPVLDELASTGIKFNHAYSQPLCTPSRVKIMTGKSNAYNYWDFGILSREEKTIGHVMKEAGYNTCIAGKWQLYGRTSNENLPVKGALPEDCGFDESYMWQVNSKELRYWGAKYEFNGKKITYPKDVYGPDKINDKVLDFITRKKDEPFFIYYPMIMAHSPFPVTPFSKDMNSKDNQKNFEDMIFYMDHLVGRIVKKLDELDVRDNTVIIFTTDNGTHKLLKSKLGDRMVKGAKGKTIDYGIHAPLIVNWQKEIKKPIVNDDIIELQDFLPTVADLGGGKFPVSENQHGISFAPILQSKPYQGREAMYMYYNPRPYEKGKKTEAKIFAQDKVWKLYSDGTLYNKEKDILEVKPITNDTKQSAAARAKLQKVLDAMPSKSLVINPDWVE